MAVQKNTRHGRRHVRQVRTPTFLGKAQRHRSRCSVLGWMACQGSIHIATTYLILVLLGLAQLQLCCTKPTASIILKFFGRATA
jgi:hypothetical protein